MEKQLRQIGPVRGLRSHRPLPGREDGVSQEKACRTMFLAELVALGYRDHRGSTFGIPVIFRNLAVVQSAV